MKILSLCLLLFIVGSVAWQMGADNQSLMFDSGVSYFDTMVEDVVPTYKESCGYLAREIVWAEQPRGRIRVCARCGNVFNEGSKHCCESRYCGSRKVGF